MTSAPASARARLARGSLWTITGTGIQYVTAMLASIAVARLLGPVHFGELGLARSTIVVFTLLAGASIAMATARTVAGMRSVDRNRAGRVIGLLISLCMIAGVIATLLAVLLAPTIAAHVGAPQLTIPIAIGALLISLTVGGQVMQGALSGLEAFGRASRLLALEGVLNALLMTGGAWLRGVTGAMIGLVVAAAIVFVARQIALVTTCREQSIPIHYRRTLSELAVMRSFVGPAVLSGLCMPPFEWLARAVLARQANGLAEVGVFGAAYAWAAAVLMVPSQMSRPAMAIMTNLLAEGNVQEFRGLRRDTLFTSIVAAALAAVPIIVLAPWIMRAYGAAFGRGTFVLVIAVSGAVIGAASWALRASLLAAGSVWMQCLQSLATGVTLIAVFWFTRAHGAIALAVAYAAAWSVSVIIQAFNAPEVSKR